MPNQLQYFVRLFVQIPDLMFTGEHEVIPGDGVFPLNVELADRKHILYEERALATVIQFYDVQCIARLALALSPLDDAPEFIDFAGQGNHPVDAFHIVLKAVVMRTVSLLISFQIWLSHILEELLLNNVKACLFHNSTSRKVPSANGEGHTFDPTTYIPHIGQR